MFNNLNEKLIPLLVPFTLMILELKTSKKSLFLFDEIEYGWNTSLIQFIFKLFNNKYINKNDSQLIFTTHNPIILDNFDNKNKFLVNDNTIVRADLINPKDKNFDFTQSYLLENITKNHYDSTIKIFINIIKKVK